MPSGYVSAGTNDAPADRDAEWHAAQAEIEDNRRKREAQSAQQEGTSLYDILQNNKAAKQEAFEESAKLKNQFRTLDDDEVDFLDHVLQSTREKERAVQEDTQQQLQAFRRLREEADKDLNSYDEVEGDKTQEELSWCVGKARKRKRRESWVKGVKLRKGSDIQEREDHTVRAGTKDGKEVSPAAVTTTEAQRKKSIEGAPSTAEQQPTPAPAKAVASPPARPPKSVIALGLAGYSSDEDG